MSQHLFAHYVNSAFSANERGDFNAAVQNCRQALLITKDIPEAWYSLGVAQAGLGARREALDALAKANRLTADSPDAQNSIGLVLTELGEDSAAEKCFLRALKRDPGFAFAHANLGQLRARQGRLDEAQRALETALGIAPEVAEIHANLGGVYNAKKLHINAEAACRKAIGLAPELTAAWSNLGAALNPQKRFNDAEAACRRAIEIAPNATDAWVNLGGSLNLQKRYPEAEAAFRNALRLNDRIAEAWTGLGNSLKELKQLEAALDCYQKSLALNPRAEYLPGALLHTRMDLCDWSNFSRDLKVLTDAVSAGRVAAEPFILLPLSDSLPLQRRLAELYVADQMGGSFDLGAIPSRAPGDRIRVGYFSADFRNHAVSILMAEVFELHDRSAFEVIAFSFGPESKDEMGQRVRSSFDRFIDVRAMSDREVALIAREMGIDVAVDLGGYTGDNRAGIFAWRAAPVQVSYLGYLGTMGAPFMDYLLADQTLVPAEARPHYAEKIAYLPSYQANDRQRVIADRRFTREELGLPEDGFVFCCFNSNYKLNPETFDSWMRILHRVEGSVLMLYSGSEKVAANLRKEAVARGIAAERLVFGQWMSPADNLARYRSAGLFLDTGPYNAGTTASDALWAGLPVLTLIGRSFSGRVAASILEAIGLPELIAKTRSEYEDLAVDLATSPQRLTNLKKKLESHRLTSVLFDSPIFARHLEAAFKMMIQRYQSGLLPETLCIENAPAETMN